MLDINVNLFLIEKLSNVNIKIVFYKKNYGLIQNNIILIDIRNRDLFFLNF